MIDPLEIAQMRADVAAYLDNGQVVTAASEITVTHRTPTRTAGGRTTYAETTTGPYPVVVTTAPRRDIRISPGVEAVSNVWLRAGWDVPVGTADRITLTYLETGEQQRLEVVGITKRSLLLQLLLECKEIG